MATLKMERNELWEVNSRTIVYAAIGAALYGILLVAQIPIPGSTVSIRPAFAIVPFFGYAFGPIVGFFAGLVGNAIGDQISGWGALTSWNWSIANGVVGLLAGLAPLYLARWAASGNVRDRAIGGAIGGAIAVVIGFLLVFSDMAINKYDFGTVLSTEYLPVVIGDLIATIILVPILVYAWEPVKAQLGR
jgi:energy-coupling factor transport system substrate-specific component